MKRLASPLRWLVGALTDPISKDASISRIAIAVLLGLDVFAVVFGLTRGLDLMGIAAIVTALTLNGIVALATRVKATPEEEDDA